MSLRMNLYPKLQQPTQQKQHGKLNPTSVVQLRTRCSSSSSSPIGDKLAVSLTKQVAKRNTLLAQTREAIRKTRLILFTELCLYLSMETHELRAQWSTMEEHHKWDLVTGFVSSWALNFHPLSPKSVKALLDEELSA